MKRSTLLLCLSAGMFFGSPVFAFGDFYGSYASDPYASTWIFGGGYSFGSVDSNISRVTDVGSGSPPSGDGFAAPTLEEDDQGFNVFTGFRFSDYLIVEGHYADLGQAEFRGNPQDTLIFNNGPESALSIRNQTIIQKFNSYGVSALITFPVNKVTSIIGRIGLHRWGRSFSGSTTVLDGSPTLKRNGIDALFGLGLKLQWNDEFSFRAEFTSYSLGEDSSNNRDAANKFGMSIVYHFHE